MTSVTLTLHGPLAERIVKQLADEYATCVVRSRLPIYLVNAPWPSGWMEAKATRAKLRREWNARNDAKRAELKRAILDLIGVVPEVPAAEWPKYEHPKPGTGTKWVGSGEFSPLYKTDVVRKIATAYAELVWDRLVSGGDYLKKYAAALPPDLPPGWGAWRVQQEADGKWSAYEGEGFRKGGMWTAQEAKDWITGYLEEKA